jgi:adenylosuccinate synthase
MDGRRHVIVADLGFGDAGKGTIVDWLASPYAAASAAGLESRPSAVVRFSGGAQAAHNVVTPDGRHHTFAQFGSGTLWGVPTFLSRFMLVDPFALADEADHLASLGVPDPLALVSIDRDALLTTPYHALANRAKEAARGTARHGSCGMGIGEAMAFAAAHPDLAPRAGDTQDQRLLAWKLAQLEAFYRDVVGLRDAPLPEELVETLTAFGQAMAIVDRSHLRPLLAAGSVIFEGSQGILLDQDFAFHPFATYATTTFDNAETLLAEAGQPASARRVGVMRTYLTRHGAGPFPTEDASLAAWLPEAHNGLGRWQGAWRVGNLDLMLLRYALAVAGGADELAVTHLDRLSAPVDVTDGYEVDGDMVDAIPVPAVRGHLAAQRDLAEWLARARPARTVAVADDRVGAVETVLGVPVTIASRGPATHQKSGAAYTMRLAS